MQFVIDWLDSSDLLPEHCFTWPDGETCYATGYGPTGVAYHLTTSGLLELIKSRDGDDVEASLTMSGFRLTHFVGISRGRLHDEGIDGARHYVSRKAFMRQYPDELGRIWTVET